MRGQASALVPGDDVIGSALNKLRRVVPGKRFVRDVAGADAMAVRNKAHPGRELLLNGGECLVGTGGGDAVGGSEQSVFKRIGGARPFGNLNAGAELGLAVVERVRKEPWNERPAGGAFYELRGAHQNTEDDAQQGRRRDI